MRKRPWTGALFLVLLFACAPKAPPHVANTDPENGARGVRLDRTYRVRFSSPIAPESLGRGAIRVRVAGVGVRFSAELAEENRLLRLRLEEDPATLPAEVTIELTARLRDPSGRALLPYTWRFVLADWVPLDPPPNGAPPQTEFALLGAPPTLAWTERQAGGALVARVARWADGWEWIADPLDHQATSLQLARDPSGTLHAAWHRLDDVKSARWQAGSWTPAESQKANPGWTASVPVLSRKGPLALAWREYVQNPGLTVEGRAARYQNGWRAIPAPFYRGDADLWPGGIAVQDQGVWVVYSGLEGGQPAPARVRVWTGAAWEDRGTLEADGDPATPSYRPRLVATDDGRILLAWLEDRRVFVAEYGARGLGLLPPVFAGEVEGFDLAAGPEPYLALDPASGPIEVRRFSRGAWQRLPGSPGEGGGYLRLALTARDTPVVAFLRDGALWVRRLNRVAP